MKTIEIVTHCYAMKDKRYAAALAYQLSSLILHKPLNCNIKSTVCYCPEDIYTYNTICHFFTIMEIQVIQQSVQSLGRRSIGRNIAAKSSTADVVWFADADYFFGNGALTYLADISWLDGLSSMVYPNSVHIHKSHAIGDGVLNWMIEHGPTVQDLDVRHFRNEWYSRAIGGAQIVEGDFARRYGYLDGFEKWQKPETRHPFKNSGKGGTHTPEDIVYRKFCQQHGTVRGVNIPGIFRIRHSNENPSINKEGTEKMATG